jgi:hypothetical protein
MKPYLVTDAVPDCMLSPDDGCAWAPPLDEADLAVRLESAGITSSVARSQYGFRDVWAMANAYLPLAQDQKTVVAPQPAKLPVLRTYLDGLMFALPLICCCLMGLIFKTSLWGGSVPSNEANAVAIATLASFVATGGFLQVIGRQGHFYREAKEFGLCFHSCWLFAKASFITLLACSIAGFLANAYFGWLPAPILGWCIAFYLAIGGYFLMSGVMTVLKGEVLLALATLAGAGLVVVLCSILQVPLLAAQVTGICAATGTCTLLALYRFRRLGCRWTEPVRLPSVGRLAYTLWPYFAYGCTYYLFLFSDRIIAWSAHTQSLPMPVQFRGDYESALDMCLLAFILQAGWIPAGLIRFYRAVVAEQKSILCASLSLLPKRLLRFYMRQLLVFIGIFLVSTAIVIAIVQAIPALHAALHYPTLVLALTGTPLLITGLWNITLLFALSRPELALATVGWALLADVCTGYLLSRLFSYHFAVVGFDAGACVFALVSMLYCRRLLTSFDYHFFAATV